MFTDVFYGFHLCNLDINISVKDVFFKSIFLSVEIKFKDVFFKSIFLVFFE